MHVRCVIMSTYTYTFTLRNSHFGFRLVVNLSNTSGIIQLFVVSTSNVINIKCIRLRLQAIQNFTMVLWCYHLLRCREHLLLIFVGFSLSLSISFSCCVSLPKPNENIDVRLYIYICIF